jgi:thiosulfate/3-mercaptopyruvate sulfurtransferase
MSTLPSERAAVPPIVDPSWLRDRIADDPSLVLCHVGSTMVGPEPEQAFLSRHLPAARFVSLDDVLAAPPAGTEGRHPLPAAVEFARDLGDLGIGDDATVVAYDDRGGALAGRLVWMLRILGRPAALLDGGITAWEADGGEITTGPASWKPVERDVVEWPADALADADEVDRHIADGGVVIDSREPARYAGEIEPIDPVAGHVPGALNLLFADNLGDAGRFRPVDELHARFVAVVGDDERPIVYCGSGVTACQNALAMEHAGLGLPRLYVGSWSGWIADPARPVATGSAG